MDSQAASDEREITAEGLPLAGLRVVEFTHMVMGPTAGLILGDLGAEVFKVEPLKGDNTRRLNGTGAGFYATYNRNKKSLALDLKSPDGLEAARRLAASADVVTENFRPGGMDGLGLGYEALSQRNPGLVYCSLKGFLPGPYEHRKALDEVVQMMGGLAYMTGPPGRPLRAGASINDVMGGMFAVIGILAALRERDRTGRGQYVQASLFENNAFLVGQHMAQFAITGKPADPMPKRISAWAVYEVFDTADEEQLFVGIVSDTQWRLFCEAFGRDDLLADPSIETNPQRVLQRDRLVPLVAELFGRHTKAELAEICDRIGLPFAPITRPEELFDDPHLNESGGLVDIGLADGSRTTVPGIPLEMDGRRFHARSDPPMIGEHTRNALRSAGYSDTEIDALIAADIARAP